MSTPASQPVASVDAHLTTSPDRRPNPSPNKRKRTRSPSSSSSLSSAQSLTMPEDFGAASGHGHPVGNHQSTTRSRSEGQRSSRHQQASSSRLRSSANPTTHVSLPSNIAPESQSSSRAPNKKSRRSQVEPEYDIDELSRRKNEYLGESFHDYNTIPRPLSDVRDAVKGQPITFNPDTSQPPPPVIHPNRLLSVQTSGFPPPTEAGDENENQATNVQNRRRTRKDSFSDPTDVLTPLSSSSPVPLPLPPSLTVGNGIVSRGTTPRATRLQPSTRTRRSARVFIS